MRMTRRQSILPGQACPLPQALPAQLQPPPPLQATGGHFPPTATLHSANSGSRPFWPEAGLCQSRRAFSG